MLGNTTSSEYTAPFIGATYDMTGDACALNFKFAVSVRTSLRYQERTKTSLHPERTAFREGNSDLKGCAVSRDVDMSRSCAHVRAASDTAHSIKLKPRRFPVRADCCSQKLMRAAGGVGSWDGAAHKLPFTGRRCCWPVLSLKTPSLASPRLRASQRTGFNRHCV